jgi:hypothetical protein
MHISSIWQSYITLSVISLVEIVMAGNHSAIEEGHFVRRPKAPGIPVPCERNGETSDSRQLLYFIPCPEAA